MTAKRELPQTRKYRIPLPTLPVTVLPTYLYSKTDIILQHGITSCKCSISFSRMPTLHTHMVTQWSALVWSCLLLAGWLLNLLFVPEDGSSMCLRNVGKQAESYTQSHPRWSCSSLEVKFDALIFYERVPCNFSCSVCVDVHLFTNSIQLNPSREADSFLAIQDIVHFYWTRKSITALIRVRQWLCPEASRRLHVWFRNVPFICFSYKYTYSVREIVSSSVCRRNVTFVLKHNQNLKPNL
jgi:hypothetical protein